MIQPLPVGEFEWMTEERIKHFKVEDIPDDVDYGYALQVDLHYPPELHDLHNDYPLAPEMSITHEMLSLYQQELKKELGYEPTQTVQLLPNLNDKEKDILHYRNLTFYLAQGLKLKKIHKIPKFWQTPWLKPYIELNTRLRAESQNKFEKDFFKLMNNSVFEKTMEDIRKRVNIKLVSEPSVFKKNVAKVTYKKSVVFVSDEQKEDYFVEMNMKRFTIILEKCIYTGFSVLDLSKLWMYDFHHNYILKKYGPEKVKLGITDTDSLTYKIETEDIFKDLLRDHWEV